MHDKAARAPQTLVLLHGFGGTRRAWDRVITHLDAERYRALALDLPGHGRAAEAHASPITLTACIEAVLDAAPDRFALCGYSMGGRIALALALAAPRRVRRLTLLSSSPGIEDPAQRARRRAADLRLAGELERMDIEEFATLWRAQPIFAGDPPEVDELAREDQRRNDPRALAAVLRGVGTGEMDSLWGRLGELQMPVTVVVGDRDLKFRALGERVAPLLRHGELLVLKGGHRLTLENPVEVGRALSRP